MNMVVVAESDSILIFRAVDTDVSMVSGDNHVLVFAVVIVVVTRVYVNAVMISRNDHFLVSAAMMMMVVVMVMVGVR